MAPVNQTLQTYDGVGVVMRGNLLLVLYGADARLHRTAWIFDRADEFAARIKAPFLTLMIIAENAAPPDAPTRAENARRFKRLHGYVRGIVTVALGDTVQTSIVRAVMRAMLLLQGQSSRHSIALAVEDGISLLLNDADSSTPNREQIRSDLQTLRERLERSRATATSALPARAP